MSRQAKVHVVIYTVYHHVYKLGVEVQKGLESSGVDVKMFQGNRIKKKSVQLKSLYKTSL